MFRGLSTIKCKQPMVARSMYHVQRGTTIQTPLIRSYGKNPETNPHQWQHRMEVWDRLVSEHSQSKKMDTISASARAINAIVTKTPLEPQGEPDIKIIFTNNGEVIESIGHSFVTTPASLLSKNDPLTKTGIVALVNGEVWDLHRPLESASNVEILDFNHPKAQETLWHSSAHILGQSMEYTFKDHHVSLSDGPALVDGGFFYDAFIQDKDDKAVAVTAEDLSAIQKTSKYIINQKQPFLRLVVPISEARHMFKHNPFKHQTLDKILQMEQEKLNNSALTDEDVTVTLYRCGPLIDLCRGPHIPRTDLASAFQLTKNSSSLMKNPVPFNDIPTHKQHVENTTPSTPNLSISSVQRVYGISFPTSDLLKDYNEHMKLAEQADHRRLGRIQELFMFHPISPGSAFFLPHGTRVYNKLIDYLRGEYRKRGYFEVRTPQVFDKSLWVKSGHWDNYAEDMFYVSKGHTSPVDGETPVLSVNENLKIPLDLKPEEMQCVDAGVQHHHCDHHGDVSSSHTQAAPEQASAEQALKPMNCPGHCVLFGSSMKSYRDLPLRIADFGGLHRNEISGALSGLTRVRSFTQDDAHIFCTADQMADELKSCLEFIQSVYSVFNFPLHFKLSTRPDNWIGELDNWNRAEASLTQTLNESGVEWTENPGDGAFYGPKVDVTVRDALGRYHQCATIQLDFNLPQRFGLKYKGADGADHTPVMIHRAILGSIERFMAVLLEHTIGKLPLWLSPRQVFISLVSEQYLPYAEKVKAEMESAGYYVDIADASQRISKQVKMAHPYQYNYIVTVGESEELNGTLSVRPRGAFSADKEPVSVSDFMSRLKSEIEQKL